MELVEEDLRGRRALCLGRGVDAGELARRGAAVFLVDPEAEGRPGVTADRWSWTELDGEWYGRFDLVCSGLLRDVPDPLELLARVRSLLVDGGAAVLGAALLPRRGAVRYRDGRWAFGAGALARVLADAGLRLDARRGGAVRAVADRAPRVRPHRGAVTVRFPAGHYYSPQPDDREVFAEPRRSQVFAATEAPGLDWRAEAQLALAGELARQERLELEIDPRNDQFHPADAWLLEGVLRRFAPSRMIEIGSGFSSLVSAQVNRECFGGQMRLTLIEPYPRDFLRAGVDGVSELRVEQVQDTPLERFAELRAGDVLFVDTSHVVKTGGDVPWIYGEILPRLAPGVLVHIHDVFLPFEYPERWVREGWGWNEQYLVRALLTFSAGFEVVFSLPWMRTAHPEAFATAFPGLAALPEALGGSSLWIRRQTAGPST